MILIFLGAPGSGKGTLAKELQHKHKFKHISTGDLFRSIIASGSQLGKELDSIMSKGHLIDDEMTNKVFVEGMKKYDLINDKIILDGYPRTLPQVEFLDKYVKQHSIQIDHVVLLDISESELLNRLTGRRVCPHCGSSYHIHNLPPKTEGICDKCGHLLTQRPDDAPENVKVRLATYHRLTAPLITHYKNEGLLRTVDANGTVEESLKSTIKIVKS